MVYLLYNKDGIKVIGEDHVEPVTFLNNNFEHIIMENTYAGNIDKIDLKNKVNDISNNIINIETGYFFYSFNYQVNYQHFLCETLPKLKKYILEYKNVPLLILEHFYNKIQKELLDICDITNIIILKNNTIYNIINYIPPSHHTLDISLDHLWIYNLIRNKLNITPNIKKDRLIYLKRDDIPNAEYNNNNFGSDRRILNDDKFCDMLISKGFEIIPVGTLSIVEKSKVLKDAKMLITLVGTNCMNLIFTNAPETVIFISNMHNHPFAYFNPHYYLSFSEILNNTKINTSCLSFDPIRPIISNKYNIPFYVDIDQFENMIDIYLNTN